MRIVGKQFFGGLRSVSVSAYWRKSTIAELAVIGINGAVVTTAVATKRSGGHHTATARRRAAGRIEAAPTLMSTVLPGR